MTTTRSTTRAALAVTLGAAAALGGLAGCGGAPAAPADAGQKVELTPGMEQMKEQMLKNFTATKAGKRVVKPSGPPKS